MSPFHAWIDPRAAVLHAALSTYLSTFFSLISLDIAPIGLKLAES